MMMNGGGPQGTQQNLLGRHRQAPSLRPCVEVGGHKGKDIYGQLLAGGTVHTFYIEVSVENGNYSSFLRTSLNPGEMCPATYRGIYREMVQESGTLL